MSTFKNLEGNVVGLPHMGKEKRAEVGESTGPE